MWQQSTWSSRRRPAWWRTGVLLLICALAACSTTTAKTQHPTHNPTHNPTPAPAPTATFAPCATPTAASSGMPSPTPVPLPPSPSLSLANWHQVASPCVGAEGTLIAVTARSATDAWAVGQYEGSESRQRTLTEHWDGAQWSFVDSPSPGQRYNLLRAVAAVAATDVWAVGSQITASGATQTLALHWDGSAWRLVATPDPGSYANQLNGVATISSSDVWAVGAASKGSLGQVTQQPLIEHWNGTQWSVVTGTPHSVLYAVAAVSSGDVWAVGGFAFDNTGSSTAALIEHWDGHQWTSVPGAPAAATYESLTGIVAISSGDVWAVGHDGFQGCGGPSGGGALIEHWNGSRWSRVTAPAPPSGQSSYSLVSVAAGAANTLWAVGNTAAYSSPQSVSLAPVVAHWDGIHWSLVSSPNLATAQGLMGVTALSSGAAWTVGQVEATNGPGATLVEHWSASAWSVVASPSPGTLSNALNGVTASGASDSWAVGSSAGGTLTEHWDGASWSVSPSPNGTAHDNTLRGVASLSPSDVWAVGAAADEKGTDHPLIAHYDGAHWSLVPATSGAATSQSLYAVAGSSSRDIWAVGGFGALTEHWNGSRWSVSPTPSSPAGIQLQDDVLFGVVALSATDVWAVGGQPLRGCGAYHPVLIEHWNGTQWSVVTGTPDGVLYAVAAAGPNDVWAVGTGFGDSSSVMHWDGTRWSVVHGAVPQQQAGMELTGIVALAPHDVWAVGRQWVEPASGSFYGGSQFVIEHWDGKVWRFGTRSGPGLADNVLTAVTSSSAGDLWAVGAYTDWSDWQSQDALQALIEHYTG